MKKNDSQQIDFAQKIARLEEEIRKTPYHKGTEHHIGKLRAKIAKLKNQEEQAIKKAGGSNIGFIPKKGGDATIVLIGPPSVGKSTLLNKLTQAQSRVESWPFTTVKVVPGMWDYQGAKIQIFDLPGILTGAALGVGRGREVLSATRSADLLIVMVDIKTKSQIKSILKELKQVGVSLPVLTVVNKIDLIGKTNQHHDGLILISVEKEIGLEELKEKIWQELKLMRVYLKPKGKEPDFQSPLIMKEGQTINDVVKKTFTEEKTFSQILLWGPSARFPAQQVSLTHHLSDGDILSFF
jgi:small GTP-binding protein